MPINFKKIVKLLHTYYPENYKFDDYEIYFNKVVMDSKLHPVNEKFAKDEFDATLNSKVHNFSEEFQMSIYQIYNSIINYLTSKKIKYAKYLAAQLMKQVAFNFGEYVPPRKVIEVDDSGVCITGDKSPINIEHCNKIKQVSTNAKEFYSQHCSPLEAYLIKYYDELGNLSEEEQGNRLKYFMLWIQTPNQVAYIHKKDQLDNWLNFKKDQILSISPYQMPVDYDNEDPEEVSRYSSEYAYVAKYVK